MKNLYKRFFSLFLILLLYDVSYSQTYITWDPIVAGGEITGSAGQIDVEGTQTNGNTPFNFSSPAQYQINLIVNGANTFSTKGPEELVSRDLTFIFTEPVIITKFNMVDIDGFVGAWDDSFNFTGINFTNNPAPTSINCIANLNGAIATTEVGENAEYASWFCSNPITTFTVDYQTNLGLTHSELGYSIEVLIPPTLAQICLNDIAPDFPVVGNGIIGTWSPNIISTDSVGDLVYSFTPNEGQSIQCPIEMTVSVIDCCEPTLLSSINISELIQKQRSDWISSSDYITFSDNVLGNGVVYTADNFIELTEGFEAIFGSKFAAYPKECPNSFVYKNRPKNSDKPNKEMVNQNAENFIDDFYSIYPNPIRENLIIKMKDAYLSNIKIYSLDGKNIIERDYKGESEVSIDLNELQSGVYVIEISNTFGFKNAKKIIKL